MLRLPAWARLTLLGIVLLGIAAAIAWREYSHPKSVADFVDDWGRAAPLAFVVAHTICSLVFIPRTPFALAAGALFGAVGGTFWSLAGAMSGAMAGFWIARHVNDGLVAIEDIPRLGPLIARAETGGWRFAMVVRLLPLMPHAFTNYAFGLTRIPTASYALGTLLGLAPQTIAFVKLGEAGATAARGAAGWVEPTLWGVGLLVVAFVLPRLLRERRP